MEIPASFDHPLCWSPHRRARLVDRAWIRRKYHWLAPPVRQHLDSQPSQRQRVRSEGEERDANSPTTKIPAKSTVSTPVPARVTDNTAEGWPAYWSDEILLTGRVQVAARAAVAVGGLLTLAGRTVVGIAWNHWAPMASWLACTLSVVSLVLPALAFTSAVRARSRA